MCQSSCNALLTIKLIGFQLSNILLSSFWRKIFMKYFLMCGSNYLANIYFISATGKSRYLENKFHTFQRNIPSSRSTKLIYCKCSYWLGSIPLIPHDLNYAKLAINNWYFFNFIIHRDLYTLTTRLTAWEGTWLGSKL